MAEIEDYYTYYVHIVGVSEDIFWNADVSFVRGVADNFGAYDSWKNFVREEVIKRDGK